MIWNSPPQITLWIWYTLLDGSMPYHDIWLIICLQDTCNIIKDNCITCYLTMLTLDVLFYIFNIVHYIY